MYSMENAGRVSFSGEGKITFTSLSLAINVCHAPLHTENQVLHITA